MISMMNNLRAPVLGLPRSIKRLIVVVTDASLCALAVWTAFFLRLGEFVSFKDAAAWSNALLWCSLTAIAIAIPIFTSFGLYREIFRHTGLRALVTVTRALALYGLVFCIIFTVFGVPTVPRSIGILQPLVLLAFVGLSRMLARFWLSDAYAERLKVSLRPKGLIYGAGAAGRQLAAALRNSLQIRVVGYIDDDERLHGHTLDGKPIYSAKDLGALAQAQNIQEILLALPSVSRRRRNEIIDIIRRAKISVRSLPSVGEIIDGRVSVSDLRELDIDDLLGRDVVLPNQILLAKNISSRTVLVTGAGGSIGAELCRQIFVLRPAKLLLLESNEYALHKIYSELLESLDALNGARRDSLVPLLGSVQNEDRMLEIMRGWEPNTIYHAAAYKHVPLVEQNVVEGVANNVFGAISIAQAAIATGVENLVLISTDKAVRPTNVMGASKRMAELCLQSLHASQKRSDHTRISIVRFGNVLDSSGSVIPLFRRQIQQGGPITLTHPDICRYFMTIPEAAQLVIQASAMAKGGDVFLLDMGKPVRIFDLAVRMVELSGLAVKDSDNPDGDIEIEMIGLRPGEKLYEELLIGENPQATIHPKIYRANEPFVDWRILETDIAALRLLTSHGNVDAIIAMLKKHVLGYEPHPDVVDLVHVIHASGH